MYVLGQKIDQKIFKRFDISSVNYVPHLISESTSSVKIGVTYWKKSVFVLETLQNSYYTFNFLMIYINYFNFISPYFLMCEMGIVILN